eukprot:CAMPEP_0117484880 /NCGR_PEP_ID=MMETSP0784-20121206/14683_1 /TAXON_ID=39447 /ORGANISM="" /LENGTH=314 /DNA_ID=CAMNT_0005279461 /DNA_START=64 /DNA_END=1008 /DNA_ORIENTATION=-
MEACTAPSPQVALDNLMDVVRREVEHQLADRSAALDCKERALEARERALEERERELQATARLQQQSGASDAAAQQSAPATSNLFGGNGSSDSKSSLFWSSGSQPKAPLKQVKDASTFIDGEKVPTTNSRFTVASGQDAKGSLFGRSASHTAATPKQALSWQTEKDATQASGDNVPVAKVAQAQPARSLFGANGGRSSKSSLFGASGGTASVGLDQGSASTASADPEVRDDGLAVAVDRSDPGRASELRAQFERPNSSDEVVRQKSWTPKIANVPLPNGSGTTTVHVHGSEGAAYKVKTAFAKSPPEKKSLADLP